MFQAHAPTFLHGAALKCRMPWNGFIRWRPRSLKRFRERVATDFDTSDPWRQAAPIDAALLVDLLAALSDLDATQLSMQLVEHALSSHNAIPMDAVLVPAALRLTERMQISEWAPVARLHAACVRHLQARFAQPLAPPSDFTRPGTITCQCASCKELSAFLPAPDRRVWEFKAAEPLRSHVKYAIRQHHYDLDFVTEKRRRPYSLVGRSFVCLTVFRHRFSVSNPAF